MGYFKTTLSGLSWTAALRGSIRLLAFVRLAILARLLLPEQFGAFGVAAMALALLEIMTETGINVFLLQEKDGLSQFINTAWLVSIFRGLIIALLVFVSAPLVANFFSTPDLAPLLYLTCLVPVIRGFINPANVKFQKDLQFNREFAYRLTIFLVESIITVSFAVLTHSAASFVWGLIFSSLIELALSFILISPRPHWSFKLDQLKLILNRGKWVTGFGLFDYVFTQGDNITVGRLLGQAPLGVYRTAYSLSTLPVNEIVDTYYKVSLPVYVKLVGSPARLKSAVLKSVGLLSLTSLIISLAVFFLARPFVLLVLGSAWHAAIPVVKVLAFVGLFRSLSYSFNSLFVALRLQKYVTFIIFTSMLALLVTIVPAVSRFGVIGAGYSAVVSSLVSLPVAVFLAAKTLKSL